MPPCGTACSSGPTHLLDDLAGADGVVDVVQRYCAQLPVAVISDILGVPRRDRPQILRFGELGAPSLDIGLSWQQYRQVHEGIVGFNTWLRGHLQELRRNPGDDLMSQLILASAAADAGHAAQRTANSRRWRVWCWPRASRPP